MPYVALDSFDTDTLDCLYCKVTGINGKFVSGYDDLPALVAALLAWFAMCFVLRPLLRLKNDVEVRGPAPLHCRCIATVAHAADGIEDTSRTGIA